MIITSRSPQPQSQLNSNLNRVQTTLATPRRKPHRRSFDALGEGVLNLNTGGGMMVWQRGPTFTFLIGDTVSVTTSGHQRNAIEFAGKPTMAQH